MDVDGPPTLGHFLPRCLSDGNGPANQGGGGQNAMMIDRQRDVFLP